jgi:hypothetical protein
MTKNQLQKLQIVTEPNATIYDRYFRYKFVSSLNGFRNIICCKNKIRGQYRTLHRCFLPSFGAFGQAVSEEKIFFRNQPIRKKTCLWQPCLLMDRDEIINLNSGPTIDASYQVAVHLAKRFQRRRFFLENNQSETRIACDGHVC